VPIIITTLQKFPFVSEQLAKLNEERGQAGQDHLPTRKYAVIIDEAHSSQSGETATELKGVLGGADLRNKAKQMAEEEEGAALEGVFRAMAKRGRQANISFFAFTATPKYKTFALFGRNGEAFHRYTMRQAIDEGFIEDVLKNYVTYKTYYKLLKKAEQDPHVERKKAAKALARFMKLHPHNIAQKTEVMVEHFFLSTRHKIGGHAKAIVVTGSRLEAVRYKQGFDQYIQVKGYPIRSLVAFSGKVEDDKLLNKSYTEVDMNGGIKEKDLPEAFATPEYQVLLVAEKYQTGFDQPLLHTMYVDKRLSGIQAVQTLSRLNRTHPLKEDTFVLDFVNKPEEIQEAFKQYFDGAVMGEEVDPDRLYELKDDLDSSGIYLQTEVDEFCRIFFAPKRRQSPSDHKAINAVLDQARARFVQFQANDAEEAEQWRGNLQAFSNLYSFLSQVIPYQDSDLEKLYTYLRHLALKLPKRSLGKSYQFDDEIDLNYYRLQKISEGSISLAEGQAKQLDGPHEVGTGVPHPEQVPLSRLIDLINERFGGELNDADQLFFDQIVETASQSENLEQAAKVNSLEKFRLVFNQALDALFIERMELNEELFADYMGRPELRDLISDALGEQVYMRFRETM
jgi:type I restriction enzyme R subunit